MQSVQKRNKTHFVLCKIPVTNQMDTDKSEKNRSKKDLRRFSLSQRLLTAERKSPQVLSIFKF